MASLSVLGRVCGIAIRSPLMIAKSNLTINDLPNEILIFIFAQQDEKTLSTILNAVCKRWRNLSILDSCWNEAFQWKWGSLPCVPFAVNNDSKQSVKWKREFIVRLKMAKVWEMGSLQAVTFDSSLGAPIDTFSFVAEPFANLDGKQSYVPKLMTGSTDTALVTTTNPKTGKISREGLKVCRENEEDLDNVEPLSALLFCPADANGAVWTLGARFSGALMACYFNDVKKSTPDQASPSASNWSAKEWFPPLHSGRISSLYVLPPQYDLQDRIFHAVESISEKCPLFGISKNKHILFFTGGADGTIGLWSTLYPLSCIARLGGNSTSSITKIVYCDGKVIASTTGGTINVWTLDLIELVSTLCKALVDDKTFSFLDIPLDHSVDIGQSKQISAYNFYLEKLLGFIVVECSDSSVLVISLDELSKKDNPKVTCLLPSSAAANTITFTRYCPASRSNGAGILAVGYANGTVDIFNTTLFALTKIARLTDQKSGISCIYLSSLLLVTGCDDGSIFIYDTVTFTVLRSLNNKHRNQNVFQDRFKVTNIALDGFALCISQSQSVTSWSLRDKQVKTPKKPTARVPVSFSRGSAPTTSQDRSEIIYQVSQTMSEVSQRRNSLEQERKRVELVNGNVNYHDMSEQELLEYAKVLSVHESVTSPLADHGTPSIDMTGLSEQEALDLALAMSLSMN